MKKATYRIVTGILLSSLLVGCSSAKQTDTEAPDASSAPVSNVNPYPVKGNPTLKVWAGNISSKAIKTNKDAVWEPELEKITGVKIDWTHSVSADQFNLMLASGDLPDIIYYDWIYNYAGGPTKALDNNLIMPLNDVINKYSPNFKKYLKEHPNVDKRLKTDEGKYGVYPTIRDNMSLRVYFGPIVRKDWLDELSINVPETIDDWYTMLKTLKEKKNLASTLTWEKGLPPRDTGLIGSYGMYYGMYIKDGKVKYGPAEPQYKDFMTTMAKWYKEGLIDPDIATVDKKVLDSKFTSEKTAVSFNLLGGGIGNYMSAMEKANPKVNIEGIPYPVLKKGDKPQISSISGVFGPYQAAISTQCKNVEAAARWLDYAYSEEGHMFYNFGMKGISYNMENGYPKYTDDVMKAPQGPREILGKFTPINGAFVNDVKSFEQYSVSRKQQTDAIKTWTTETEKYLMPEVYPTSSEMEEISTLMNDIKSYVDEMYLKFLFGNEKTDNMDGYYAQLKKLKVDRAIQLYQNAYDRFQKR